MLRGLAATGVRTKQEVLQEKLQSGKISQAEYDQVMGVFARDPSGDDLPRWNRLTGNRSQLDFAWLPPVAGYDDNPDVSEMRRRAASVQHGRPSSPQLAAQMVFASHDSGCLQPSTMRRSMSRGPGTGVPGGQQGAPDVPHAAHTFPSVQKASE